jgi:hypothetical protein
VQHLSNHEICGFQWVPISSTGKVFCRRARDLGSNPAYTKNQLVSWSDDKSNYHEADAIGSNTIAIIKKKKKNVVFNKNTQKWCLKKHKKYVL